MYCLLSILLNILLNQNIKQKSSKLLKMNIYNNIYNISISYIGGMGDKKSDLEERYCLNILP